MTLLCEAAHPCTTTFGRTTEGITIEDGDGLAVFVNHLIRLHVGVVYRNIGTLLEGQSIDFISSKENTIDQHAVNIEVGLHIVIVDVELLFLHLGRIVETVVGLQLEVGTHCLTGIFLDSLGLCVCLRLILTDQTLQESIDILWCLRHGVLQRIRSIVGLTHQLCLLGTQFSNLNNDREGVVLSCAVSTVNRCFINLLAEFAVVETGQRLLLGGVDNHDGVWCFLTTTLGIFGTLLNICLTESGQVFFLVYPYDSIVGSRCQHVAPLCLQLRDTQVDLLHTCHLIVGEQSTLTNELLISFFEEFLVFTLKTLKLLVIYHFDAFKQRFVEHDVIFQFCQHGLYLLLDLTDLRCLVGTNQGEEDVAYTIKCLSAFLKCQDRILKGCRIGVVDNAVDLSTFLLNAFFKSREVIRCLDLTEIGHPIR